MLIWSKSIYINSHIQVIFRFVKRSWNWAQHTYFSHYTISLYLPNSRMTHSLKFGLVRAYWYKGQTHIWPLLLWISFWNKYTEIRNKTTNFVFTIRMKLTEIWFSQVGLAENSSLLERYAVSTNKYLLAFLSSRSSKSHVMRVYVLPGECSAFGFWNRILSLPMLKVRVISGSRTSSSIKCLPES